VIFPSENGYFFFQLKRSSTEKKKALFLDEQNVLWMDSKPEVRQFKNGLILGSRLWS
jgi:hypothetical protein